MDDCTSVVQEQVLSRKIKHIVLVDGDAGHNIPNIFQFAEKDIYLIHVHNGVHPSGHNFDINWFFEIITTTRCKGAADTLITMLALELHYLVPKDCTFYIISRDSFVPEVFTQLERKDRMCTWLNPGQKDVHLGTCINILRKCTLQTEPKN